MLTMTTAVYFFPALAFGVHAPSDCRYELRRLQSRQRSFAYMRLWACLLDSDQPKLKGGLAVSWQLTRSLPCLQLDSLLFPPCR
jgi:hypothetical protein